MKEVKHYLFSYGTLQKEKVQQETFGRKLEGINDEIENYSLEKLEIKDKEVLESSQQQYHPIAIPSKLKTDSIKGVIFELTEDELMQSDRYEVSDYKRVWEVFKSGRKSWIYILK